MSLESRVRLAGDEELRLGETNAMQNAGFPVTLVERNGGHSDATTDPDLVSVLLPQLDDGWLSPP